MSGRGSVLMAGFIRRAIYLVMAQARATLDRTVMVLVQAYE